jgi:hypothetical protein
METTAKIASAALAVSIVAVAISSGSMFYTKQSYDLNAARDKREQAAKLPAIDVHIVPRAAPEEILVELQITNRADINIAPQAVTISAVNGVAFTIPGPIIIGQTGIGQPPPRTLSAFSLLEMGSLAPGKSATLKLTAAAKEPPFPIGMEVQFAISIRFADEQDTVQEFRYVRRITFG